MDGRMQKNSEKAVYRAAGKCCRESKRAIPLEKGGEKRPENFGGKPFPPENTLRIALKRPEKGGLAAVLHGKTDSS